MKRPNRVFAPIIIAGITVGFLVSAYKFVVAKTSPDKEKAITNTQQAPSSEAQNRAEHH